MQSMNRRTISSAFTPEDLIIATAAKASRLEGIQDRPDGCCIAIDLRVRNERLRETLLAASGR